MTRNPLIHHLADVQTSDIGAETRVWQFTVVLPQAKIGSDCNICSHCFIENDVIVGDRVTVKSGVQLWDGVRLEDDVFIGPNVTFTNDSFPRSKAYPIAFKTTTIQSGASVGGGGYFAGGHNGRPSCNGGRRCCSHSIGSRWCGGGRKPRSIAPLHRGAA